MIKDTKRILKNLVGYALQKSPTLWQLKTLSQLRFKFDALKYGIEINRSGSTTIFNLRRNIHRLEKGLSYANKKDVFAEDYIGETIIFFELAVSSNTLDPDTQDWAVSVLSLYFDSIVLNERLSGLKAKFKQISFGLDCITSVPYPSSSRPDLSVSYDNLLQLSKRRRSVRYFYDRPVEISDIKKAYEIAKYAPSACNRQAFQFLFFDDKDTVNKLSQVPGGVSGYSLPSLIVVLGRYDGYFDVRDINAPVIDSSLSIMSFLYAAETLGLGTVCINWPNLPDRESKLRKILNIDRSEFVVMMIGIGYPQESGKIPFSAKRPIASALLLNERIK